MIGDQHHNMYQVPVAWESDSVQPLSQHPLEQYTFNLNIGSVK